MTSIIKKKIRGRYYYYAVESKRVDGKPRIVWQKYLGKVNDIVMAVTGLDKLPVPQSSRIYDFGIEAALLAISKRLDVTGIINRHVAWQGEEISVGEILLLYAIHFTASPGVKLPQWFERTMLKRYFNAHARDLTEKRFQAISELLTPDIIQKIQNELAQKIVEVFGLRPEALVHGNIILPSTIESQHKKDHSGPLYMSALITREFSIPLFYKIYPGGLAGEKSFAQACECLIDRYCGLGYGVKDVTVVYHAPFRSWEDDSLPAGKKRLHRFIGEHSREGQEEILSVPMERFYFLRQGRREKIKVYRASKRVDEKNIVMLIVQTEAGSGNQHEEAAGRPCSLYGKRILVTDNIHWDNGEIHDAYFGRKELEEAFARMKPRPGARAALKSSRHTNAYLFCLILALTLQSLLRWELHRCGMTGSIPEILKRLSEIREVAVTYAIGESQLRKKEHVIIAELNVRQKEIFDCLHLTQFAAGGGLEDIERDQAGVACPDGGDQESSL